MKIKFRQHAPTEMEMESIGIEIGGPEKGIAGKKKFRIVGIAAMPGQLTERPGHGVTGGGECLTIRRETAANQLGEPEPLRGRPAAGRGAGIPKDVNRKAIEQGGKPMGAAKGIKKGGKKIESLGPQVVESPGSSGKGKGAGVAERMAMPRIESNRGGAGSAGGTGKI